jgi:hypothetical protein
MNKKIGLIVLVIAVLVAVWLIFGMDSKSNNSGETSTNPADYQNCVKTGGKLNNDGIPTSCVLDGKTYYDGNF